MAVNAEPKMSDEEIYRRYKELREASRSAQKAFDKAFDEEEARFQRPLTSRDFLLGVAFNVAALSSTERVDDEETVEESIRGRAELVFKQMVIVSGDLFERDYESDSARSKLQDFSNANAEAIKRVQAVTGDNPE